MVVLFTPVKFCKVVEPVCTVLEKVDCPPVATRLVPTESAPVVVALVEVELIEV